MPASSTVAALVATALLVEPPTVPVRERIQALYDAGEFEQALTLTVNEYRSSGGEGVFLYAGANAASAMQDCPQAVELYERALAKADNPKVKEAIAAEIQNCRDVVIDESTLAATYPLQWADAERALGRCEQATASYQRALRRQASEQERLAAQRGIEACQPEPTPSPSVVSPSVVDSAPSSRRPDRVSTALFATGGGVTLLGVGLVVGSVFDARGARDDTEQAYRDRTSRSNALLSSGVALGVVGVGLLVGATVRWALRRKRARAGL